MRTLETAAASAWALVVGLVNVARGKGAGPQRRLAAGDRAPEFTMSGSDGREYRLSDFIGREAVVLSWFPKAFTGGCTIQCRSLSDRARELETFTARCFAVSVERPDIVHRFAERIGARMPILSDPDGRVARAYGVLGRSGFANRHTVYIGVDGRVLAVDRDVAWATHGEDVVARLDALKIPRRADGAGADLPNVSGGKTSAVTS